jgi:hypothetical protein
MIKHTSHSKGPSYSIHVDGDGNIEYNGISNVKTIGKYITKISPQDLNHLIREFNNIYFFSFKNSYEISSNQSISQPQQETSISLTLGDRYKIVKYVEGAYRLPTELKNLVEIIERVTKVDKFVKD